MDRAVYDRLIASAASAVRYGYQYRIRFEADIKEGNEHTRYCLHDLDVTLAWAGLAVLSGILGNATWEAIKVILKKIVLSDHRATGLTHTALIDLIADDDKLKAFGSAVYEFNQRIANPDPRIEGAIVEEQIVHLMMRVSDSVPEVLDALRSTIDEQERETLRNQLLLATRRAARAESPLSEEDVSALWKQVDCSG